MESDMVFNVGKSSELEACTKFWLAGQFENFDCRLMIYPDSDPDPDSYRISVKLRINPHKWKTR